MKIEMLASVASKVDIGLFPMQDLSPVGFDHVTLPTVSKLRCWCPSLY